MAQYHIGDLISCTYVGLPGRSVIHDPAPHILVLHHNWKGHVHGLNFKYINVQEQNYIRAVVNDAFAKEIRKKDRRIDAQLKRVEAMYASARLNIASPHDFYIRFVRGFIQPRGWDPYRLYHPRGIVNVKIIKNRKKFVGEGWFNDVLSKLEAMRGPRI